MKRIGAMVLLVATLSATRGQGFPAPNIPVQSASGQFVVFTGASASPALRLPGSASDTNSLVLEPTLLVVSCERIKQRLWGELGATAPWRGKICFDLHPARSADDGVTVVTDKSPREWNYRVILPDTLPRDRFVRAIVQVLLLEIANRNAGARPAEIPTWLAEGLSRELRTADELELILPPPGWNVHGLTINPQMVNARWSNPLEPAQKELRARSALTFEQLSWPEAGQLAGDTGETYRCSAQFFVDSLLRMADGPACLRTLLEDLPRYYNWQSAFLHAFRSHFQNPLAVEKWWAVQVVQFTGRDLSQTWPPDESWRKLDQVVHTPVDVRTGKSELPLHTVVSLQTIIREWDRAQQMQMLQRKLAELEAVRLRVAPAMISLVDDYRGVIQSYLQQRSVSGLSLSLIFRKQINPNSDRAAEAAIRQLNTLDQRRETLRPAGTTAVRATIPVLCLAGTIEGAKTQRLRDLDAGDRNS